MTILEIHDLIIKIDKHFILGPINIAIKKNSVIGIIGENGSGKSSLLYAITKLLPYSHGQIYFKTKDIRFAFQQAIFYPNKSVIENLRIFSKLRLVSEIELLNVLIYFEIEELKNIQFKKLSEGNKKRLEIIQAILSKPELVLFDEPTANIDEKGIFLFNQIIEKLKEDNVTILITNHYPKELLKYCTEFLILKNGKQIDFLSKTDFIQKYDA